MLAKENAPILETCLLKTKLNSDLKNTTAKKLTLNFETQR